MHTHTYVYAYTHTTSWYPPKIVACTWHTYANTHVHTYSKHKVHPWKLTLLRMDKLVDMQVHMYVCMYVCITRFTYVHTHTVFIPMAAQHSCNIYARMYDPCTQAYLPLLHLKAKVRHPSWHCMCRKGMQLPETDRLQFFVYIYIYIYIYTRAHICACICKYTLARLYVGVCVTMPLGAG
jgi:hypothetical protein